MIVRSFKQSQMDNSMLRSQVDCSVLRLNNKWIILC